MTETKQPTWISTYPERESEYARRIEPNGKFKQYGKHIYARWAFCPECSLLLDPLRGQRFDCPCGAHLPAIEAVVRFWSSDPFRVRDAIKKARGVSPALYQGSWDFSLEPEVPGVLASEMFVLSDTARKVAEMIWKEKP